jgi:hypothetical protein
MGKSRTVLDSPRPMVGGMRRRMGVLLKWPFDQTIRGVNIEIRQALQDLQGVNVFHRKARLLGKVSAATPFAFFEPMPRYGRQKSGGP